MPNTASTPSAFRHSIIASTARMRSPPFGLSGALRSEDRDAVSTLAPGKGSAQAQITNKLSAICSISCRERQGFESTSRFTAPRASPRSAADRVGLGPVEVLAAAHADLVGDRAGRAAARACPPRLVALPPVKDRPEQPDERQTEPDQEPDQERAALDLADDAGGKP